MKLCLGTVQFGLDYGLRGKHKLSREDSVALLDYAVRHGIDAIDTSALYGDAEEVVGAFLSKKIVPRANLFLVSKFGTVGIEGLSDAACAKLILERARCSLVQMGTSYLDALICHVPTAVYDERVLQAMDMLKKLGLARHVGFSVYETVEASEAIKSGVVDFLQIPLSVLDQRMANDGILDLASQNRVVLHSRSVYLQGTILMDVDDIPDHLSGLRPAIMRWKQLCKDSAVSQRDLALAFVRSFPQVSHIVFGAHDQKQLAETIASFAVHIPADIIKEARQAFADLPPELVMPNKWSRK